MSIQCFKLVLLSILLLPFYTWATLSNVANVADVGNVVEINGKAEQVKIIREKKTFSAKPALQLFVHDITQTGDLSTAKLLLKKVKPQKNKIAKVSVFVFENSQFRLNPEILTEGGRKSVIIELSKGILSLIVDKLEKDTDVRVKTPNAVIGIRGSIITLSVQEVCEEGGTGCSLQTSILQANGDIKVLPPQLLLASLDSKAAVTVPSGAMYTISTTAKDTKEPFSAPTEASTSTPSTTTEPSQTSPPSSTPGPEPSSTPVSEPLSSVALVPIAPAPLNVSVMLDANPLATFNPSQPLTLAQVSEGNSSTSSIQSEGTSQEALSSASDASSESVSGIASLTANTLSSEGSCR